MKMFNKRITCRLLACLLFFNCLPALLFAQGTQAIITGTVVDNKGESVIGATIQVKNESTGFFTDHQKKSQKATRKRQVLQNQYFVGLFLLSFGYLDRHEKVTDRQKLVPNSYPRQNSSKRGTICRKMAKCCRDLATLHLSHYELIKVVL